MPQCTATQHNNKEEKKEKATENSYPCEFRKSKNKACYHFLFSLYMGWLWTPFDQ
jgi:hypothetical protein